MESIGYLHLASAYEASESIEVVPIRVDVKFFSWKKLSSVAAMRFLSVALTMAVLSVAGQAFALQSKPGSSGANVTTVQRCLKQLGYYNGPVTGNFGSLTRNAVIKFQQRNGLATVGSVGPQTQRLLQSQCQTRNPGGNAGGNVSGDLRSGSKGQAVTRLQQNLRSLGFFKGAITGYFGSETQQAVARFQQSSGMRADGVVGSRTRQAILVSLGRNQNPGNGIGGDSLPNALNEGDGGNEVTQLQTALRQLRYLNVNPTGYFGPTTKDAVARFQRDFGLVPNGIADSRTLATISRALASVNPGCVANRGDICLGENSQRVVAVQQRLRDWGFLNGNINGLYSVATKDAVAQFQRYYGLNPTGFVDFQTWQALKLGNNGGPTAGNPTTQNRYVVIVPIYNQDTLNIVRQYVRNAFPAQSRLGDYVNAGAFNDRADAEKLSKQLRDRGLDARVDYF
jgi:peptidoglycan hydrolase-like protein with peptidoglycan-binding domain